MAQQAGQKTLLFPHPSLPYSVDARSIDLYT